MQHMPERSTGRTGNPSPATGCWLQSEGTCVRRGCMLHHLLHSQQICDTARRG